MSTSFHFKDFEVSFDANCDMKIMPFFTDESTSQHKSKETKDRCRQTSKEQEENTGQFVEDLGRKQKKENRKRKSKVKEQEVQGDAPERKKKKKHKSMKAKKDERRSVEDIEQAIEDSKGYRLNKEIRKNRGGEEEEDKTDTPEIKKKKKRKHKGQKIKGNKQRSVEEDIENHVEDYKGIRQEKETWKSKGEVEVQDDVPKKKKRKHKSQETKEIKQQSVEEEEDKEKHVDDFSGYRKEKETRNSKGEVEVQNDAPKKKKKKEQKEEEMHEEGNIEHKHQRNKKRKKNKKGGKRIPNDENNNEECVEEESKKTEQMKNPELTESIENQRQLGNVPDQRNKAVKPKKRKKNTTKAHPVGGLPYDEDVNPIHFEWEPSKEIKEKFNVRQGRWTKQEEKILLENMECYLLENNLDDPSKLIFSHLHGNSDETKKWKEFARTTDFYRKLGKGLNRSIFLIYRKVLRSFNEGNYLGPFTESEDRELEKLVSIHGRKWEKIGRIMGRSGLAVSHRYYWNCGTRGKWKDDEIHLLKEAVRNETKTTEGEEIFTNINWSAVASTVKTRNAEQCRKKWIHHICWKETTSAPCRIWSWKDDLKLIKLVYESSATNESEIDWCELHKHIEIARSPEWLNNKFKIILRRYCNSSYLENTDFEEVIGYLYNVKRKEMEDKYGYYQDQISE